MAEGGPAERNKADHQGWEVVSPHTVKRTSRKPDTQASGF
jgi:hypothetical protein